MHMVAMTAANQAAAHARGRKQRMAGGARVHVATILVRGSCLGTSAEYRIRSASADERGLP